MGPFSFLGSKMTPRDFLDEVAHPNMVAAFKEPDDLRAIVNAILSLDALAGALHAHASINGRTEIVTYTSDEDYREALAAVSRSFRVLRDASASLKHGNLGHPRKHRLARLVRSGTAFRAVPNGLGLYRCGDPLGSEVIVIEFDPGPGYVRASSIIANSYRMLKRIVDGEAAQIDEHDHGTFLTAKPIPA